MVVPELLQGRQAEAVLAVTDVEVVVVEAAAVEEEGARVVGVQVWRRRRRSSMQAYADSEVRVHFQACDCPLHETLRVDTKVADAGVPSCRNRR